jgi:site-specific DNA-methyltransferase (adenine-specific)
MSNGGSIMSRLPLDQILIGDARQVLAELPTNSVDCVITSPPYFRLRNYQDKLQIGLEAHVDDYVRELVLVARKLARVLKPGGALWLNLGDTFSRADTQGASEKSLVLAPERLALALIADGWILRNKIIWAKTNPMPTSVRDRLSCTHEVVYFFVRERRYFFDLDAIRIPHKSKPSRPTARGSTWSVPESWRGPLTGSNTGLNGLKAKGLVGHPLGKNPGDVWPLATAGYRGAHHAVFPEKLVERPLLATCPEKVCRRCGKPWTREPMRALGHLAVAGELRPTCACNAVVRPGVVLDPFLGSGTVAAVASRLGRHWLGIELNPAFARLTDQRLAELEQRAPPLRAA